MSEPDSPSAQPAAVEAARRRHAAALRSYVGDLLHADQRRMEEALAATWHALELQPEVAGASHEAAWLFGEARRQALARQGGVKLPPEEDPGPREIRDDATVQSRFELLTAKQHEVLRLKFVHGFRHDEIAQIVDLSPAQSARLLHIALTRLAAAGSKTPELDKSVADDPRLTLAALGEIDSAAWPAGQRAGGADVRSAELREAARWVAEHFAGGGRRKKRSRRTGLGWCTALATVAVAVGLFFVFRSTDESPRAVASSHPEERRETPLPPARNETARTENASSADDSSGSPRGGIDLHTLGVFQEKVPRPRTRGAMLPLRDEPRSDDPDARARFAEPAATLQGSHAAAGGAAFERPRTQPTESAPATAVARDGLASSELARGPEQVPPAGESTGSASPLAGGAQPSNAARATAAALEAVSTDIAPILALKEALGRGRWPKADEVSRAALLRHFSPRVRAEVRVERFAPAVEAAELPWAPGEIAVRFAATARAEPPPVRAGATVIFLIDTSASMDAPNRLPLVQEAVAAVLDRLRPEDRVGIVTYAGESRVLVAPGTLKEARAVRERLQSLEARGQTNGGAGLETAFALAVAAGVERGEQLVILCTDGEFNLGLTSEEELGALVQRYTASGVRLAVFGFGRNGEIDPRLELLAHLAGGGSGYVNTRADAVGVMLAQLGELVRPVAEHVRLQVEAAGEVRATGVWAKVLPGETLAEIVTVTTDTPARAQLTYRSHPTDAPQAEVLAWNGGRLPLAETSAEFRCEAAVARLADLLARAPADAAAGLEELEGWVRATVEEAGGYRAELLSLIVRARAAQAAREI